MNIYEVKASAIVKARQSQRLRGHVRASGAKELPWGGPVHVVLDNRSLE